jgi:chaperonin GroES
MTKRSLRWLVEAPDNKNLAKDLAADELSAMAQDVLRSYDIDRANRAEWDAQSERALKLAKQILEKKSTPWEGAANVKYPLITVATIQFAARAYPEICKGQRVVKCQITGDDPKKPAAPPMISPGGPPAPQMPGPQAGLSAPQAAPPQAGPMPAQQAGPDPRSLMMPPGAPMQPGNPGQSMPQGPEMSPMGGVPQGEPMPESPKQQRANRIACFSHDTEILTALGWRPIWDVIPGTFVYSRRPDGTAELCNVTGTVSHFSENIVHVSGQSLDLFVTEEHNMLLEDTMGESFFKSAGYFLDNDAPKKWYIPVKSISRSRSRDDIHGMDATAYLKLLGWYISEGSAQYSAAGGGTRQINPSVGSFKLCQSETANPDKHSQMLADVENCGITYGKWSGGITLHAKSMPDSLKKELRSLGRAHEKFVPRHVMFYAPELIQEFLSTLFAGDGSVTDRGYQSFVTTSKQLADDVQELCQLAGDHATIAVRDNRNRTGDYIGSRMVKSRRISYDVTLRERSSISAGFLKWKLVPYNDRVFCVEVAPWHTLYVRRKGKAAWIGNCHMNWQITQEQSDWEADTDCMLHVLPVVGQCYKKTYFSAQDKHNISELVLPDDCVVSKGRSRDIKKARRITHRLWIYGNEAVEKMRSKIWLDVDLGTAPTTDNDTDAPHEFYEQHRWDDLDGDGYKEPYIVTVHKETSQVVRIVARWDVDGIEVNDTGKLARILPDHYFTHFGFIPNPDGSINYLGFGQLLEAINASANTTLNQLLDAGTLANAGGGFIGKGVRLRGGSWKFRVGEWKLVDVHGAALKENIVPLPAKEPSAVLFQLLGFLVQAGKDISSLQDILAGDAKLASNMPVGTIMALVEQGLKVFTGIYKRIYRSLSEEFKKMYNLNARFLDPEVSFYVSGHPEQFVSQSDYIQGDTIVMPVADPELSSDMQRVLKSQALKELSGRPGLNEVEMTRRLVRAVRPENVDDLLLTDGQLSGKEPTPWSPPPAPQQVLAQAKAQRMTQQAQEAQVRLQMDMLKFKMELQKLEEEIANVKADTMLKLSKTEATGQAHYLEYYKIEMDRLGKETEARIAGVKNAVDQFAGGAGPSGPEGPAEPTGMESPAGDMMRQGGPMGMIPGRAEGGPVAAGQPYMVGEAGPEKFVPMGNPGDYVSNILTQNKGKNFVQRLMTPDTSPVLMDWNGPGTYGTHAMASGEYNGKGMAYPTIIQGEDGKLVKLPTKEAAQHAIKTGEYIEFPTSKEAEWFGRNYKSVWGQKGLDSQ